MPNPRRYKQIQTQKNVTRKLANSLEQPWHLQHFNTHHQNQNQISTHPGPSAGTAAHQHIPNACQVTIQGGHGCVSAKVPCHGRKSRPYPPSMALQPAGLSASQHHGITPRQRNQAQKPMSPNKMAAAASSLPRLACSAAAHWS